MTEVSMLALPADSIRIYKGDIFFGSRAEGVILANAIRLRIEEVLFPVPPQNIHRLLSYKDLSQAISDVRRDIFTDTTILSLTRAVMAGAGIDPDASAIDPPRLRALLPDNHHDPASKQAYALHRDTWYANPQAQINWWIPLYDVLPHESFSFYPEYFDRDVPNSSENFDFAAMLETAGWQGMGGGRYDCYPAAPDGFVPPRAGFTAKAGDILAFSAAHLHGTCRNDGDRTRWSIDFRSVSLADHAAGRGAVNKDNASSPDALTAYMMPSVASNGTKGR